MIRKAVIAVLTLVNAIASFFNRHWASYSLLAIDHPLLYWGCGVMVFMIFFFLCAMLAIALGFDLADFHD